jgi:hypothetical protein
VSLADSPLSALLAAQSWKAYVGEEVPVAR